MRYKRKQSYFEAPINVNIALTEQCSLQCPFCFHEYGHGANLDFSLLKSYLDQLAQMGACCVQYSGGDPLLYPYLEEAIEHAHKLGLYTRLSTSGSTLTFAYAKRLKKAGLDCCHLSLNGSTQEIHSKTRDGFMETMDAMRIVSEVKVPCAINWVANHANVPDLIHVIELAQSMQVNYISILANKPSRDMELFFPYSYSDLIWLKKLCEKYPEYLNVESCFNELRLLLYGTKIPVVDKGCKAGRFHMAIDVRGTFLPCPHLDALGEKMKDIATYWNTSEVLGQIRECFRHGMGNRVSQCDISETSLCNHCRYKQCCNPCYIGQNGQLLRCADRRTCIIFNKSS